MRQQKIKLIINGPLAFELGRAWRTYRTAARSKHQDKAQTNTIYRKNMNVTKKKEEDFIFFILLSCRLFTHILAEEGAPFDAII